jgi:hypothetical protein
MDEHVDSANLLLHFGNHGIDVIEVGHADRDGTMLRPSAAFSRAHSPRRSAIMMRAPAIANPLAIAPPMPPAPPVTRTHFPSSLVTSLPVMDGASHDLPAVHVDSLGW